MWPETPQINLPAVCANIKARFRAQFAAVFYIHVRNHFRDMIAPPWRDAPP
jgi:hypothetical protein